MSLKLQTPNHGSAIVHGNTPLFNQQLYLSQEAHQMYYPGPNPTHHQVLIKMGCNYSLDNQVHDPNMVKLDHIIYSKRNRRATAKPLDLQHADACSDTEPMLINKQPSSANPENWGEGCSCEGADSFDDELMSFVKEVFATYDRDNSGFLDVEQFSKMLRQNVGEGLSRQQIENLLVLLDRNRNKTTDPQELFTLYKTIIEP